MHLHNYLQAKRITVRLLLRLTTRADARAILGPLLIALLPETVGNDTQSQTTYMYVRTTRDTKSVAGTCSSRLMTINYYYYHYYYYSRPRSQQFVESDRIV